MAPADMSVSTLSSTMQVYQSTVSATSSAAVQAIFQTALQGQLSSISTFATAVYADGTARNLSTDPIAPLGSSTLDGYLRRYLYDNLSAAIGLAATAGQVDVFLERNGIPAAADISSAIAEKICSAVTESAQQIRDTIYAQMVAAAPDRFGSASEPQSLPFQPNDSLALQIRFQFPASQMTATVSEHLLRVNQSNLFVNVGNKITITRPATAHPQFSDFPQCVVYLRVTLE
jgi:hypothetical protein